MKTLLILGPHPPPIGGGTVNMQILLQELAKYPDIYVISINTSPTNCQRQTRILDLDEVNRGFRIVREYLTYIRRSDSVLIIGTAMSIFSLGSLLLLIAKINHVPCYIKPLGGDIHFWLKKQKKTIRKYLLKELATASGVFVQTRQLQSQLLAMGCKNISFIPGYRPPLSDRVSRGRTDKRLRLVFLSQIYREKGAFLLLDALHMLSAGEHLDVICDFYGPILDEDRHEFLHRLEATPGAKYLGIANLGTASQLMKEYDSLVFPTLRAVEEGYPGVIIEAMQAGIPVISTNLQSISELITDRENGLLIPIGDSCALARAIKLLASDRSLREKMKKNSYRRGLEYRADRVINKMLQLIFPAADLSYTD